MKKLTLSGKDLRAIGFPESPAISVAMRVMEKNYKFHSKEEVLELLKKLLESPASYREDAVLSPIALQLLPKISEDGAAVQLNERGIDFEIFGQEHIEQGALHQMHMAAKLPIAVAGALMPDAHSGYGLPIGGVLATRDAVIPYGVGVDIGCRMCLSVFDIAPADLQQRESFFSRELQMATLFGSGAQFEQASDHPVMDDPLFQEIPLLKKMQGRAWKQLGSSGSGNHFVEFGEVSIAAEDETLQIAPGKYLGLLSHSGSRGLGATIANHYTKLAIDKRHLPKDARNLAWLLLEEEAGMEYWMAMNLAGEYAAACHQIIHQKIAKQLGRSPVKRVENHHNFAWKEQWMDEELIVHRKGATPAGKNVLGIIPGSMTANGYIVKGRGLSAAVNSASHGAGRKMSRTAAMQSITKESLKLELAKNKVKLLGGGLDEAPFAYKDIETVMQSQQELVDIVGTFTPKIVKMDGR